MKFANIKFLMKLCCFCRISHASIFISDISLQYINFRKSKIFLNSKSSDLFYLLFFSLHQCL